MQLEVDNKVDHLLINDVNNKCKKYEIRIMEDAIVDSKEMKKVVIIMNETL